MKKITIVSPCFNEEENIHELYNIIKKQFEHPVLAKYQLELIFIDNKSTDNTRNIIKAICNKDKDVKAIFNAQNFGHIRSPYHGLLQATGDCAILMASDLQDPVDMLPAFVVEWEKGNKIVLGAKMKTKERFLMAKVRKLYYQLIKKFSDVKQIEQFTGYGLYDQSFLEVLRNIKDSYPYFRGLIAELGYSYVTIPFTQPRRSHGLTKNNFYTLYDMAMLGFTSYTKKPLRKVTLLGALFTGITFFLGVVVSTLKILFECNVLKGSIWETLLSTNTFLFLTICFFAFIQIFLIGFLGEYIMMINTRTMNRPYVVEEERINFNHEL